LLGVVEKSDDQLLLESEAVDLERGFVLLDRWQWSQFRSRGLEGLLLDAMEESGVAGVVSLLAILTAENGRVA
jgi:hypothetical protein